MDCLLFGLKWVEFRLVGLGHAWTQAGRDAVDEASHLKQGILNTIEYPFGPSDHCPLYMKRHVVWSSSSFHKTCEDHDSLD